MYTHVYACIYMWYLNIYTHEAKQWLPRDAYWRVCGWKLGNGGNVGGDFLS
jgi:hypothetical protein